MHSWEADLSRDLYGFVVSWYPEWSQRFFANAFLPFLLQLLIFHTLFCLFLARYLPCSLMDRDARQTRRRVVDPPKGKRKKIVALITSMDRARVQTVPHARRWIHSKSNRFVFSPYFLYNYVSTAE